MRIPGLKTKVIFALIPLATILLMIPSVTAQSGTQIVFSNNATGNGNWVSPPKDTHFGFWYWCQLGGNGYGTQCGGSIYIYGLQLAAVGAHCDGAPCVISNGGGSYTLKAIGSNGWVCSLTNTGPVTGGPTNTITMTCDPPTGTGTALNSVVIVS